MELSSVASNGSGLEGSKKRKISTCSRCANTPGYESRAAGHIARSSSCPSKHLDTDGPSAVVGHMVTADPASMDVAHPSGGR